MYLSPEVQQKLKALSEKEKRNPSQELLILIDFYEKNHLNHLDNG